jgi:RHS repeat-associated protein
VAAGLVAFGAGSGPSYTTHDSYGFGGWLSSQQSPAGVLTQYGYDAAGEKTSVTDGASNKTSYGYDPAGRQTSITYPDLTQHTVTYDEAGRQTGQADLLTSGGTVLRSASAVYDGDGSMLSATDFRNNTTTYTYDPTGLVASESQPVTPTTSITTSFTYDAAGNRTSYTDGNTSQWWTTYNSWNLPEQRIEPATSTYASPSQGTFTTAYDANGNVAAVTAPGAVTISNVYDNMNELKTQSGTGAGAPTATRSFTYDNAGNMLTAATAAAGSAPATSESFTYSDRGLPLTASGSGGSSSFSYNGDGQLASVAGAAGTTSYMYDSAGRLQTLTEPLTATTATYSYNNMSQPSQISYGTGNDVRAFGYDNLHRLTADTLKTSAGATVASIGYGYDPNGNLTSKTTTGFAGSSTNTYGYDEANRLTSWISGTTTTSYAYDKAGNLTQAGNETLSYDARDQLSSTTKGTTTTPYTYTARGTMATAGPAAYTSDAYGQAITSAGQTYGYDALGRLLSGSGAGSPFTFTYAGPTSQIASDGTWNYTYDPTGTLAATSPAGGTTAQASLAYTDAHTDVVGSYKPVGTALAGSASYDPYGNITASSSLAGNLGYQSAFTDPATSQVHMGARWYAPGAGQFTSKDTTTGNPVPSPAAVNPFAYAADNPLVNTDPTGDRPTGANGGGTNWSAVPPPPPPPPSTCGYSPTCWLHVNSPYYHPPRVPKPVVAAPTLAQLVAEFRAKVIQAIRSGRNTKITVTDKLTGITIVGDVTFTNPWQNIFGIPHDHLATLWASDNYTVRILHIILTAYSGNSQGNNLPLAAVLAGHPNSRKILADYKSLLQAGPGANGRSVPQYLQWLTLAHTCSLHPGLCPSSLAANASHQAALGQYANQLALANYYRNRPTGGVGSLLLALGLTIAAATAPEALAAGYEAAFALSVRASAWWYALGAGGAAASEAPEADSAAAGSRTVSAYSVRWPDGSPFYSAARSADGTWQIMRGAASNAGSAALGAPASYASLQDATASSLAEVLTENEDDIASAIKTYSGAVHDLVHSVPAVSDPVSACAVVTACVVAGTWQHFFGK